MPSRTPSPWTELQDHLEAVRRSILAEIRSYPPPIAACDQQFNYLLEQRDRIARDLSLLTTLRENATRHSDVKALLDFVDASDCIPHELRADLLQQLHQRLGELA